MAVALLDVVASMYTTHSSSPHPHPPVQVKDDICRVFVAAHQAVEDTSKRMWQQVKRRNYVTPTSYLETVRGYRALLLEKLAALRGKADKLRGGLTKLEETAEQVGRRVGQGRADLCTRT
jgi:hypothetical protein